MHHQRIHHKLAQGVCLALLFADHSLQHLRERIAGTVGEDPAYG